MQGHSEGKFTIRPSQTLPAAVPQGLRTLVGGRMPARQRIASPERARRVTARDSPVTESSRFHVCEKYGEPLQESPHQNTFLTLRSREPNSPSSAWSILVERLS